jgi:NTP pyrophosphatase (non-canonical NTP hydrolase)
MKNSYLEPKKLENLQKRVWEIATEHGWHDKPISKEQYCGLIMTEMSEAIEADRNGIRADIESFNERMSNLDGSDECFKEMYKRYIKGSIDEEFADVVIRLLDLAQEVHGDKMKWSGCYPYGQVYHENKSFIENAWYFIREVLNWGTMNISDCVSFMFDWAQDLGIDLWQHIEWKMKYNELRSYKHGGKKY